MDPREGSVVTSGVSVDLWGDSGGSVDPWGVLLFYSVDPQEGFYGSAGSLGGSVELQGISVGLQGTRGVLWYRVGDGWWVFEGILWILGGVLWIHRWSRGGSVGGSGIRGGSRASGKGPDPSALMETPLGYATPAAPRTCARGCLGMCGRR